MFIACSHSPVLGVVDQQIAGAIAVQVRGHRLTGHSPPGRHVRNRHGRKRAEPQTGLRSTSKGRPAIGVEVGQPYAGTLSGCGRFGGAR